MRRALLLLAGCGRVAFDTHVDANRGGTDATLPLVWGEYVATLNIADCTGPELLVNDTTSDLDGGNTITDPGQAGATLSFMEAMWIATNRAGYDAIKFDPVVFPVDAPATIAITDANVAPFVLTQMCIDGRHRGVIVDWNACTSVICPPGLDDMALLVGLTYVNTSFEMGVAFAQVAGVRFGTDGLTTLQKSRPWSIEMTAGPSRPSTVGPGNVVSGSAFAFRIFGGNGGAFVAENFIGYDPLTQRVLGTASAFDLRDGSLIPVAIVDNVIAVTAIVVDSGSGLAYPTAFSGNHVGSDSTGQPLPGAFAGLALNNSTWSIVDNVFATTGTAISIGQASAVAHRNRILSGTAAIEYPSGAPIGAPVVTIATSTQIAGNCFDGASVEVFADPGVLAAQYLGEVACTGGAFSLAGSFPSGMNALATQSTATATSGLSGPAPIQ